jgi:pyruvate/2-oxoglutarate dehydrogenase complex dihydrolipoamide dehydrogenase (E3) component
MASRYDLIVVGMGTAGIVACEFARTLDLKVAAVERQERIGGDCLWTGCVPSKALIASARAAHTMRHADRLGLEAVTLAVDTAKVFARIRAVQQEIARAEDNPERFRAMGVDLRLGTPARVVGAHAVAVGGEELHARFILLCTGSLPPETDDLTTDTIWDLERAPASLLFVGAGPTSIELAQAFARLGVRVTVIEREDRILAREEPELVAILQRRLAEEGVEVHLGVDDRHRFEAERTVVATGRRPNLASLAPDLERAKSIRFAGDVDGSYQFTHRAGAAAVGAVRDMFLPGRGRQSDHLAWCTFTDPELAHAGLTVAQARARFGDGVEVWRQDLAHNDRARIEAATDGAVVIVTHRDRIVGAHILAPAAGELINELERAIEQKTKLRDFASLVHVYPTHATTIGALAAQSAFRSARKYRWLVRRRAKA